MGDEAPQRKGWAVPERCRPSILSCAIICGGMIMNTAMARRLVLGDRVIWMGKDDCQPSGLGTITRITAHQIEVLWEGETARRYRRAQLHNLRHVKLISRRRSLAASPLTVSKAPASREFAWYVRRRNKIKYPVEVSP